MKLKWMLLLAILGTCLMILLAPIDDYPIKDRLAGCVLALVFWAPALLAFLEDV